MATDAGTILSRIKDEEIDWVDLRFTDPKGKWQHLTMASGPIDEDQLTVRHDERNHTTVDTSYSRQLELFPGFKYPWEFTIHVDTYVAT